MASRYASIHDVWSGRLYHYERLDHGRLETTLRERKVRCADLNNLNDPWDCKPWFSRKSSFLDPAGFSKSLQAEIARRRIYCLTPDPLSPLMWSHYGSNHTGICFEFNIGNGLFWKALPVNYEVDCPMMHVETMHEHVKQTILTKADCWHYEDEFRLIASPDLPIENPLRLHDNLYLRLPARTLLSVIVGCKGDYPEVKSIVQKHSPETRVIQIIRSDDEYRLAMALKP